MGLNTNGVLSSILVHKSDTVWNISKRFRLPLRDIILVNDLAAPYVLNIGQRVKLPEPKEYRVREQDTLYSISRLFSVDIHQMVQLNNLHTPYHLRTGQILRLPTNKVFITTAKAEYKQPHRAPKISRQFVRQQPQPKKRHILPPKHQMVAKSSYQKPKLPIKNHAPQKPRKMRKAIYKPPHKTIHKTTHKTAAKSVNNRFIWPVNGRILSGFGPKSGGLHNDGINIAVPGGTPVKSVSGGKVVYVGDDLDSFGNLVLIRHKKGWISAYGHLRDIKVSKGTPIKQGQVLGTVGSSGNVKTPQLHFELRKGSQAINPRPHLS